MIKKYTYIVLAILLPIIFSSCSSDTVTKYKGDQFFSFGSPQVQKIQVSETENSKEILFGFVYPVAENKEFTIDILENSLGELVSINGESAGSFKVTIEKGQKTGTIKVDVDNENLANGNTGYIYLELSEESKAEIDSWDIPSFSELYGILITKPCLFDENDMEAWEGTYIDLTMGYELEVTYLGDNTFSIYNFMQLAENPTVSDPQPVQIKVDYSIPYNAGLQVVPGYFYTSGTRGKIDIENTAPGGSTLFGTMNACNYTMTIPFYQNVPGLGYMDGELTIRKVK